MLCFPGLLSFISRPLKKVTCPSLLDKCEQNEANCQQGGKPVWLQQVNRNFWKCWKNMKYSEKWSSTWLWALCCGLQTALPMSSGMSWFKWMATNTQEKQDFRWNERVSVYSHDNRNHRRSLRVMFSRTDSPSWSRGAINGVLPGSALLPRANLQLGSCHTGQLDAQSQASGQGSQGAFTCYKLLSTPAKQFIKSSLTLWLPFGLLGRFRPLHLFCHSVFNGAHISH